MGRNHVNGLYSLYDKTSKKMEVVCRFSTKKAVGWTVIQQRVDGSVNFNRSWADYKNGFGTVGLKTNFWLGNENIYWLTRMRDYQMRVEFNSILGADVSRIYKLINLLLPIYMYCRIHW